MNPITQELSGAAERSSGQAERRACQVDLDGNGSGCLRPSSASQEPLSLRDADPQRHAPRWRRNRHRHQLAPSQRHHGLRLQLHGVGAGRSALGTDVLFDLEQISHLRDDRRGGRSDLRSDLGRSRIRGHSGANDLPSAAEDDAEGRDGDPRRQCLAAARHTGHPGLVGVGRPAPRSRREPITFRSWA